MRFLKRLAGDRAKPEGGPEIRGTAEFVPAPPRPKHPTPPFQNRRGELPPEGEKLKGQGRVKVAGASRYQTALARAAGDRTPGGVNVGVLAALVPEPGNRYDKHAVRVVVGGETAGYLSRGDARAYRAVIDQLAAEGKTAYCNATIRGGWDRGGGDAGSYGIDLEVAEPAWALP